MTSVQSRFYKIAIERFIKETKMVRNLFLVTSVQSHFYEIAISKFIKETKMVRNLFHVISVQSHLHKIGILKVIDISMKRLYILYRVSSWRCTVHL